MKNLILLILITSAYCACCQNIIIKDSLLDIPIENVSITYKSNGISTNSLGIADVSSFNNSDTLNISHVAYHTKKVLKSNLSNITYLQLKVKVLPTVNYRHNTKVPFSEKNPLFIIHPKEISVLNSSTSDLLATHSAVVSQESQAGGGSPNYRGMEANRLLLVVDGIPINNAIYRSGHLQSSATINPFFIHSVALLSGPASVAYGNGAMGGALLFNTVNNSNKNNLSFHQQYESSSNAVLLNLLSNYQYKKTSHVIGFSIKSMGNLKMGGKREHGYVDWGREAIATNGKEQLFTSYNQTDFIHKISYRITDLSLLLLNTQYSSSSDIYRFDKMNDYNNGVSKYQKWYYGPQNRFFHSLSLTNQYTNFAFDKVKTTLAYQNIKETRHKQKTTELLLNNRNETVKIYDFIIDFNKDYIGSKFAYGIGARHQEVTSTADLSNTTETYYNSTRYADGGGELIDYFAYTQINYKLNRKANVLIGGRWNKSNLIAAFNDTATYQFNFKTISNKNQSFIKSILINYKKNTNLNFSASYYSGFRNPNIDDVAKVFSKNDVTVVVPNENLKTEYSTNFEVSMRYIKENFSSQIQLFSSRINNAISREYSTLNGRDSMLYDGEFMRIEMNQNIESVHINGIGITSKYFASKKLLATASINYLKGCAKNNQPLAHIPPLNSKIKLKYQHKNDNFEIYTIYNSWKKLESYDNAGIDNLEEATADGNPMWFTLNLSYLKKIDSHISFGFAIKNILDRHYKTFASGLSASGRNFVFSLKSNL